MSIRDYAVYTLCNALSKESGFLSYSEQNLSKLFAGTPKGTIHRAINSLKKKDWVQEIGAESRSKRSPKKYRIQSHEEWVLLHPGQCCNAAANPVSSGPCRTNAEKSVVHTEPSAVHMGPSVDRNDHTKLNSKSNNKQIAVARPSPLGQDRSSSPTEASGPIRTGVVSGPLRTSPTLTALLDQVRQRTGQQPRADLSDPRCEEGFQLAESLGTDKLIEILDWALQEQFWKTRVFGPGAFQSFIRNLPRIHEQFGEALTKASRPKKLKAQSVKATGQFAYAGEVM